MYLFHFIKPKLILFLCLGYSNYNINGLDMLPSKYLVFRKPTIYESLLGKEID